MSVAQAIILLSGAVAIWLTQSPRADRQRWAPVIGLLGQPWWLVETAAAAQWGMLALSAWYTLAWARGIKTHWFPPRHPLEVRP